MPSPFRAELMEIRDLIHQTNAKVDDANSRIASVKTDLAGLTATVETLVQPGGGTTCVIHTQQIGNLEKQMDALNKQIGPVAQKVWMGLGMVMAVTAIGSVIVAVVKK